MCQTTRFGSFRRERLAGCDAMLRQMAHTIRLADFTERGTALTGNNYTVNIELFGG